MILLFGNKQAKTNNNASKANKTQNVRNNPVENSGILAMSLSQAKSLLTMGEFDTFISSHPVAIDFAMYSNCDFESSENSGFLSSFSSAVAFLGDCGFSSGGFDCGGASFAGASCGASSSFSSVG